MLKTQQLFQTLGREAAIAFLKADDLQIQVKEYEHFCVLNYNQIFSPENNDYVMECRSLQLTYDGEVVSRAFPRFFNYGQRPEITGAFSFGSGTWFYEKADGSLIRVYWNRFDNRWEAATRGTAFAESEQDFYPTFRQAIIEDGFGLDSEEKFQVFCDYNFDKTETYVFEYCSMKNNIVTPYFETQMVLLAVFENKTGIEALYSDLEYSINHVWMQQSNNVRLIKRYQFSSYDEMKVALDSLPDLQEGFVAQDVTGLRVKFKNDLYLKLHKMRGDLGFTEKKIAAVVAQGEEEEVLTYFGQYRHLFEPIIRGREHLFIQIESVWDLFKGIVDQKAFALKVKDLPYSAILFTMRNRKKTFAEAWEDMREESRVELILNMKNEYEAALAV